jgi:SHS2 domain-containing protein
MRSDQINFTLVDHTADLGMEVRAPSLSGLFEASAWALLQIILGARPADGVHRSRTISLSAEDAADLMVRWLGEILYLLDGEGLLVTGIDVKQVLPRSLVAVVMTRDFNPAHDTIVREIKAVTYHQIAVTRKDEYWAARVIFDL